VKQTFDLEKSRKVELKSTTGQEPNRLGAVEEVEGKSDPQVSELHRLGGRGRSRGREWPPGSYTGEAVSAK
jgi:hypothetical protein